MWKQVLSEFVTRVLAVLQRCDDGRGETTSTGGRPLSPRRVCERLQARSVAQAPCMAELHKAISSSFKAKLY